jgi:hypothetical protein
VTRGTAGATTRLHLVRILWTVQYVAATFYALVDLETSLREMWRDQSPYAASDLIL